MSTSSGSRVRRLTARSRCRRSRSACRAFLPAADLSTSTEHPLECKSPGPLDRLGRKNHCSRHASQLAVDRTSLGRRPVRARLPRRHLRGDSPRARSNRPDADLERRGRTGCDGRPERVLVDRLVRVRAPRGRRTGARRRTRPSRQARPAGPRPQTASPRAPRGSSAKQPDSCVISTLRAPSSAIASSAIDEVLLVVELLADEALGLALVRRDEERLGLDAEPERLAFASRARPARRAGSGRGSPPRRSRRRRRAAASRRRRRRRRRCAR